MRRDRRRHAALAACWARHASPLRSVVGATGAKRSPPRQARTAPGAPARLRRQRGFTLIEMLVVISILGILAAVVTMSMIGVTNLAQRRANEGELMEVQSAVNFMVTDQLVDVGQVCSLYSGPGTGTNDMSLFPSSQPFQHSGGNLEPTAHQPVQLFPHYLRKRFMNRPYVCTGSGTVVPGPGQ